jgi:cytochrome P450
VSCSGCHTPTATRCGTGPTGSSPSADFPEEEVLAAYGGIWEYLGGLLDSKRADPREDMLSDLVAVNDNQGFIGQDDLIILTMTLLMVGYPTTVDMLSRALLMLLSHPDQYAALGPAEEVPWRESMFGIEIKELLVTW